MLSVAAAELEAFYCCCRSRRFLLLLRKWRFLLMLQKWTLLVAAAGVIFSDAAAAKVDILLLLQKWTPSVAAAVVDAFCCCGRSLLWLQKWRFLLLRKGRFLLMLRKWRFWFLWKWTLPVAAAEVDASRCSADAVTNTLNSMGFMVLTYASECNHFRRWCLITGSNGYHVCNAL